MIFSSMGLAKSRQPSSTMLLLLVVALAALVSAADTTTTTATSSTTTATSTTTTAASTTTTATSTTATSTTATSTTATSTTATSTTTSSNDYPVMTVPPTADAPYMQQSNLPQGTVFIAVGGALGLIGLTVLAWRGLVAWSVNRSVRKAALAMQQPSETKGLLRPTNNRRKSTTRTQKVMSVSLEKLPGSHRNSYNPRASKIPSSSSALFFSPTAGAGGMHTSGNRASSYLPAGYYAAGSATPGGAQNLPYSSSELRPQSQGYSRPMTGPSPPGSPLATAVPNNPYGARQSFAAGSTSTVNLTAPPQGRTPSAFLEDLFENHAPQSDSNHR